MDCLKVVILAVSCLRSKSLLNNGKDLKYMQVTVSQVPFALLTGAWREL